jgi:hypothetical protein
MGKTLVDDEEILNRAELMNISDFKNNMRDILTTERMVENILKSLHITDVCLQVKSNFPALKKIHVISLIHCILGRSNDLLLLPG